MSINIATLHDTLLLYCFFQLYIPLNIFITLVGVVVWADFNEITIVSNGDTTLTNFLHYRREHLVKDHPNDNAQLLTYILLYLENH